MKKTMLIAVLSMVILPFAGSPAALPGIQLPTQAATKNEMLSTVNVTFQVNMANEPVSTDGVHLGGSWQGEPWDPNAITMTDDDGDDVYTAIVPLESGTEYFYAFFNGIYMENVPDECQQGLGAPSYRYFTTGSADMTLEPVCFGYCVDCAIFHDITFQVDMKYQTVSPDGVYINLYNPYNSLLMTNIPGTSIWSVTETLMENSDLKYKFVNGDPDQGGQLEYFSLPYPPCTCGDDPVRRCLNVPNNDTTLQVCFLYCFDCPDVLISEVASWNVSDTTFPEFFIELYNAGTADINFDTDPYYLVDQNDNGSRLTGSLPAGEKYIIAPLGALFYGSSPDLENSDFYTEGNADFKLYIGNDMYWDQLIDAFQPASYPNTQVVRRNPVSEPNLAFSPAEWHFHSQATFDDMTPWAHKENVDWIGSLGADWNTLGNWSGLNGYIPDASFNVNIPNTATDPTITGSLVCNNLSLESGASLTLAPNMTLDVLGDLNIGSGSMTIQSNATGTGSMITYGGVSGNAVVQRFIPDEAWHLISSPVAGATADVFYDSYLQYYDETVPEWVEITSYLVPLNSMEGYALWGVPPMRNTYEFTGVPYTGDQLVNFTAVNPQGWNLLGNPYPSGIDWDLVAVNEAEMNNAVYYLDAATGNYVSYLGSIGGGSQYIPPMQGFWISAVTSGSLNLSNAVRAHQGADNFYKNGKILSNYIELQVSQGEMIDKTYIRLNEEATANFDGKYDAYKLMAANENYPQLFTYAGADKLSINQLPATNLIGLGFSNGTDGTYTISLAKMNDVETCMVEDLKTGVMQDLEKGSYTFSYTTGENANRFRIHLSVTGLDPAAANESIRLYSQGKEIIVSCRHTIENGTLRVTDLSGHILLEQAVNNESFFRLSTNLPSGIYLVSLTDRSGTTTRKLRIE